MCPTVLLDLMLVESLIHKHFFLLERVLIVPFVQFAEQLEKMSLDNTLLQLLVLLTHCQFQQ